MESEEAKRITDEAEIWSDFETDEYSFYKRKSTDKIWHVERKKEVTGPLEFTFDQKKIYNLWIDYPYNMTEEEIEIFDKENPFWAEYFSDRGN